MHRVSQRRAANDKVSGWMPLKESPRCHQEAISRHAVSRWSQASEAYLELKTTAAYNVKNNVQFKLPRDDLILQERGDWHGQMACMISYDII